MVSPSFSFFVFLIIIYFAFIKLTIYFLNLLNLLTKFTIY